MLLSEYVPDIMMSIYNSMINNIFCPVNALLLLRFSDQYSLDSN